MFNLLISGNDTAWGHDHRMQMMAARFNQYSGDEGDQISLQNPNSLRLLEQCDTLLVYEEGINGPDCDRARLGRLRSVRHDGSVVSFRFVESGTILRDVLFENAHRLQIDRWEKIRTHWAIKDGQIPQDILQHLITTPRTYDIVLSFAGEDRDYVEHVAEFLESNGVTVFYDRFEQATLWGKDLVEHFDSIYIGVKDDSVSCLCLSTTARRSGLHTSAVLRLHGHSKRVVNTYFPPGSMTLRFRAFGQRSPTLT